MIHLINPESLGAPVLKRRLDRRRPAPFIAGQIAWDEQQQIISDSLIEQFDRTGQCRHGRDKPAETRIKLRGLLST
jgi:hypothetical protein